MFEFILNILKFSWLKSHGSNWWFEQFLYLLLLYIYTYMKKYTSLLLYITC